MVTGSPFCPWEKKAATDDFNSNLKHLHKHFFQEVIHITSYIILHMSASQGIIRITQMFISMVAFMLNNRIKY